MDTILAALAQHGALFLVMWWMLRLERKDRIAAQEVMFALLQKCFGEQAELLDKEFGSDNK